MRKLSDTIARLAALRAVHGGVNHRPTRNRLKDMEPTGSNPGALKARTFIPESLGQGAPLVVALHGCTQSAAAYDEGAGWSDLADRCGFALLFPEQQRSNNANLCFNWFIREDAKRDAGEALSIREMIETMVTAYGLDRDRIFIVGLSAGGAMASGMLASYPDVFAGGAIIAGLPFGSASNMPEAFDRMRGHGGPSELQLQQLVRDASPWQGKWPTISVWHGAADDVVDISNMAAIVRQWSGLHGVKTSDYVSENEQGFLRKVWHGADGRERIESYTIHGMGHGTPLATGGPDGYGKAGPYMLESGISSTLRIATFWGLVDAPRHHRGTETPSQEYVHTGEILVPGALTDKFQEDRTGNRPYGTKNAHAPGIQKTIEDALRAAGLIK
ncbi:extracellular catalytic domain type 1 short-chain-length polyhydroxyalkanoate depolymerase [Mycoplana dimorpha]|uniref:Poly(Hydroxyalkanoate) depolymerase family esterase n=1 Tax=Mycoplana dimorpha TaxID=28320 RepID=A0A2T5ATT9_MYCDI|nr:PHB depolymerase family esterase [Mycoplana dimorpha]PTM90123.1 poly(hydroxyalkanoate) depolymerase family esterase [Mycoplana dimorpha]